MRERRIESVVVLLAALLSALPGLPAAAVSTSGPPSESRSGSAPERAGVGREQRLASDLDALLRGVDEIAAPGSPGAIAVFGGDAFPVVMGKVGDGRAPTIAAARLGKGRVVVLSHNGYSAGYAGGSAAGDPPGDGGRRRGRKGGSANAETMRDTARFLRNAVAWASGGRPSAEGATERRADDGAATARPLRVGVRSAKELVDVLAVREDDGGRAISTKPLDGGDWAARLADLDVLVTMNADLTEAEAAALTRFIQDGGGVVAGTCPWGWSQVHRGADLRTNQLNRVLNACGLSWTDGIVGRSGAQGFVTAPRPSALDHGRVALAALEAHGDGGATLGDADLRVAGDAAIAALRWLPADDRDLRPKVEAMLARRAEALVPTERKPLGKEKALERVLLSYQLRTLQDAPIAMISAHPAAAVFPGAATPDAPRITRDVEIDLAVPRWHGTGLYAPAGATITIEAPTGAAVEGRRGQDAGAHADAASGARLDGLAVRIGCHTDELWHHDAWKRAPAISREWPLATAEAESAGGHAGFRMEVASPFGGLIYIDVPPGRSGRTTVRIGGAVEAPRFVLGTTTAEEWGRLREAPAPWGELETSKVALSVPSAALRGLDDPTAVLELWDRVLDAAADLATIPRERPHPQRYVADCQISAGYMHSGYPIMTHLDAVDDMTRAERLAKGSWGLFHELGHNHQDGMWTFDGTGEVTCNLFSLYIMETVCGLPPNSGHGALDERAKKIAAFTSPGSDGRSGASFARWKSDPFLALIMYQQIRDAFGWDVFRKVFAEYRALPKDERPRDDDEKRNQWMTRLSRATGRNLGPFFDSWTIPVSDAAKASVADLPVWMPDAATGDGKR